MHCVVERHSFTFAIGVRPKLDLLWSFPFHRESVWDRPQVADPRVHQRERKILSFVIGGSEDRADSGHLPIVGGGINSDISGLGKSGEAGETEYRQTGEPDFTESIRADAYCDHNI